MVTRLQQLMVSAMLRWMNKHVDPRSPEVGAWIRTLRSGNRTEDEHIIDDYIENVGTVRDCLTCGALVAGGVTRCRRCAGEVM